MSTVTITSNAQEVIAKFGRMVAGLQDTKPLRGLIGEQLVESTRRRYAESKAPDGSKWAELAPGTLEQYVAGFGKSLRRTKGGKPVGGNTDKALNKAGRARLGGRKPLLVTGSLASSYFWQNEGNNLVIATNHPHAAIHQFGGKSAYTIKPKNKKALAWPGGNHPVKSVVHPPLKARPALGISDADGNMMLVQTAAYILNFTRP